MNDYIAGATGMLIVFIAAVGGGYLLGKQDSEVTTRINPLITASCIDISAFTPENKTFGATTKSAISLAGQYKLCSSACLAKN